MKRLIGVSMLAAIALSPGLAMSAVPDPDCWYCQSGYNGDTGWMHDDAALFFNEKHAGPGTPYHSGTWPGSCSLHITYANAE